MPGAALSNRDVYYIARRMWALIHADTLLAIGSDGVAAVPFDTAIDRHGGQFRDDGWSDYELETYRERDAELSASNISGGTFAQQLIETISVPSTRNLGRSLPVKLDDAESFIRSLRTKIQDRLELRLRGVNSYKSWVLYQKVKRICDRAEGKAVSQLALRTWKRKNPLRFRRVSSRHFAPYPWDVSETVGVVNGRLAFSFPPGQPSLSKDEWLRRYYARKDKLRKTKRKGKRTKQPPETKYPRPDSYADYRRWLIARFVGKKNRKGLATRF